MNTKKILFLFAALCLAAVLCVSAAAADLKEAEEKAQGLKELGLFRGVSDTDFDLGREPTRVEALVMLIRTLGKEGEAQNGTWSHPFTDVPAWANAYVGYAWTNGLTKGVSATEFGVGNASAAMYVTFMLRALGYSDAEGDFSWDDPFGIAERAGILPDSVDTVHFLRADVAVISYSALSAKMKNSQDKLSDRLIAAGVFTAAAYKSVTDRMPPEGGLTSGNTPIFVLPVQPKDPELPAGTNLPAIGD